MSKLKPSHVRGASKNCKYVHNISVIQCVCVCVRKTKTTTNLNQMQDIIDVTNLACVSQVILLASSGVSQL